MRSVIFALILCFFAKSAIAEEAVVTARIGVNFRKTPNGNRISALSKGTRVTVLPDSTRLWYHVRLASGKEGWVYYKGMGGVTVRAPEENEEQPASNDEAGTPDATPDPTLPTDTKYTMYRYTTAASGQCMPQLQGTAREILDRNRIGYSVGKHTDAELNALARGIQQVERLLGRTLPSNWRTNFNYINAGGKWNQSGSGINVRRPAGTKKGENIARLMHEYGHLVGNSGAYDQYRKYTNGKKCGITGYALKRSKPNEQFSEVFSAYVTYPDLLQARCPRAFDFFSQKLFPHSADRVATCRSVPSAKATGNAGNDEIGFLFNGVR